MGQSGMKGGVTGAHDVDGFPPVHLDSLGRKMPSLEITEVMNQLSLRN